MDLMIFLKYQLEKICCKRPLNSKNFIALIVVAKLLADKKI